MSIYITHCRIVVYKYTTNALKTRAVLSMGGHSDYESVEGIVYMANCGKVKDDLQVPRDCCVRVPLGLPAESYSDAVGQPYHGYAGIPRTRHGAADRGDVETKAIRTHQAADLENDDEEHNWTFRLPADRYLHHSLCRSVF